MVQSGEIESRYFPTYEQGFEADGFKIVSKEWLDKFPKFKNNRKQSYINYIKELIGDYKGYTAEFQIGGVQPESEYYFPLDYQVDAAI